jgi:hypothetical protein
MKKIKHNKLRNTGVIFELLVRQITADILNNKDSHAIRIVKEYFSNKSSLSHELKLYQALSNEKINNDWKAGQLLEAVVKSRRKIDESSLEKLKYSLIKRIRENYSLEEFFKHKVNNYKVLASIYKLFEYAEADNPFEVVNSKSCIFEHLTRKVEDTPSAESLIESEFGKEDKDIRLLSYKILLEKFNNKYNKLNPNQKQLLKLYITNSPNDQNALYEFVVKSVKGIKTDLDKNIKACDSQVVQIKLSEVSNLLTTITESKVIKDNHVLSLLRYFELVKELKKIN